MKRVLFLHSEMSGYFLACLKALEEQGMEVHLVQWPVNKEAPFQFDYPDSFHRYQRGQLSDSELLELVRKVDPHILCSVGWMDKGYTRIAKHYHGRIPTVLMLDNWWKGTLRQWAATLLRNSIIQNKFSHAWVAGMPQRKFARKLGFRDSHILSDLYSADVELFDSMGAEVHKGALPKRLLYTGRYIDFKGVKDLWEVFMEIDNPDWELVCAGTGPLESEFPDHPRIKNMGFVQPHQMADLIQGSGVFVMPSHKEPWGVTLHEFAAAGLPLVCSDKVGSAERYLEAGINGFMFKAGDRKDLKVALEEIMAESDERLLEMSKKSREIGGRVTPRTWAGKLTELAGQLPDKLRVLVTLDWYVPGYKAGGPIRSVANLVDHLSDEFDFSVLTSDTDYMSDEPYESVRGNKWQEVPGRGRVYYAKRQGLSRKQIKDVLTKEPFDIIYMNVIYSWWYTIWPLWVLRNTNKVKVLATRGMLGEHALEIRATKKKIFFALAKLMGLFKGVVFQASNPDEAKTITAMFGKDAPIRIASNLPPKFTEFPEPKREVGKPLRLLNVARISKEKNLLYALKVLAMCNEPMEYHIYGAVYEQGYWEECQAMIHQLPEHIKVTYHGTVQREELSDIFTDADLLFYPTANDNFSHAILEALAHGLPLVLSDVTPWHDIEVRGCGWEHPLPDPMRFVVRLDECARMGSEDYTKMSTAAIQAAKDYTQDPALIQANSKVFLNH